MPHDEATIISQARAGDPEAFSQLVELYERPVYSLCYRMLGNPHAAEDAAQEAFIRAFKAMKRYDPERKFITWLLSIASNYCIDQHRKRRPTLVDVEAVAPGDLVADGKSVEGQLLQQEQEAEMQAMLETLNSTDRAAVILHYWYQFSYAEIADQLSLTESAVKSRLHRARRSLAEIYETKQTRPSAVERRQHGSPVF